LEGEGKGGKGGGEADGRRREEGESGIEGGIAGGRGRRGEWRKGVRTKTNKQNRPNARSFLFWYPAGYFL